MKVAVDTNFLVYAGSFDDVERRDRAIRILEQIPNGRIVVPVQVLGELFHVLTRRMRLSNDVASRDVIVFAAIYQVAETSKAAFYGAIDLAAAHGFQIFDALIVASAAEAGCSWLLSEDMHDGFTWNGVTIVNPFSPDRRELIEGLIAG
jgi:predicted nucleic acid-binding protein